MTIRRACYEDVPALRRCFVALIAELEPTQVVPYPTHTADDLDAFTLLMARRIPTDPTFLCYVAEDEVGEIVAFLGGEIAQRALGTPHVFGAAHWLYVAPAARGQGLARALVRLACEDLVAAGVTHVELAALRGDTQWSARGWVPYLLHHVLPVEAVLAGAADRPAPLEAPPAASAGATAPVVKLARPVRKRRRRRPRAPAPAPRVAGGGA